MKRLALIGLLLALGTTVPATAYVPSGELINGRFVPTAWPANRIPVTFRLNDRPLSLLPHLASNSAVQPATTAAMEAWMGVPAVRLRTDGTSPTLNIARDSLNLITFADTPQNRDATANRLALTMVWAFPESGEIVEADIAFNPRERWATDGRAAAYDIQAVIVHELGHALGLDHSPLVSSAMYPFLGPGSTRERRLQADDLAGARHLYSFSPLPGAGVIAGRVETTDGRAVHGAHVVATDARGIPQVSAVTLPDGSFRLTSLPAGDYQLYAEPLDGPVWPENLGPAFRDALTTFGTRFLGPSATPQSVKVDAGVTTAAGPLRVELRAPTLNPLFMMALTADGQTLVSTGGAVAVEAGQATAVAVAGSRIDTVLADGFRFSGSEVTINAAGLQRGRLADGRTFAILPIRVGAGATPGPRNLYLTAPTEVAAFSGALEILPP